MQQASKMGARDRPQNASFVLANLPPFCQEWSRRKGERERERERTLRWSRLERKRKREGCVGVVTGPSPRSRGRRKSSMSTANPATPPPPPPPPHHRVGVVTRPSPRSRGRKRRIGRVRHRRQWMGCGRCALLNPKPCTLKHETRNPKP